MDIYVPPQQSLRPAKFISKNPNIGEKCHTTTMTTIGLGVGGYAVSALN
jgi:hypothetical protein